MSPQGKRARPRPAPEPAPRRSAKGIGLVAFGVLLIALFAIVAVAQGLGDPSVPDDAIAVVEDAPDGTVTKEEYDRALVQTAARQGLKEVPKSTDPQYQALADAAQSDLLLARWVRGEASERGIELTDREVDDELEKVKTQQFGSEEAFQKFLKQAGFTEEEARQRIELQLLSDRIQTAVLPKDPDVTAEEVQRFYDANVSQFEQPEARDVRVILTETEDEANQALAALESDDSPESFEEVAKKYSIDEATKSTGGLRQGVVAGQSEPALDEADLLLGRGRARRPVQDRCRLLRDPGREGDPGDDPVADRRERAGPPDACRPAPAGGRHAVSDQLPDEMDRAHVLRRGLPHRALRQRPGAAAHLHPGADRHHRL